MPRTPGLTAAELIAIRERLGLSVDQLAAELGITPHVVSAWESGSIKVSRDIEQQLRWRNAIEERSAVVAASGLPECAIAEELDRAVVGKEGDALVEALERLNAHSEACDLCRARVEYADRHGPAVPDLPVPRWIRAGMAIDALFDRLPAGLRPPEGERGRGRRMGLWAGAGFSALAIVIVVLAFVRGAFASAASVRDLAVIAAIIPAYFVGFYSAGAVYDALRPIGHRFIGYVLRWGIGGTIVYAAIFVVMTLIDDDPMPWSDSLMGVLMLGGFWCVIGAGLWVKDRLSGKLAKRPGRDGSG